MQKLMFFQARRHRLCEWAAGEHRAAQLRLRRQLAARGSAAGAGSAAAAVGGFRGVRWSARMPAAAARLRGLLAPRATLPRPTAARPVQPQSEAEQRAAQADLAGVQHFCIPRAEKEEYILIALLKISNLSNDNELFES